MTTVKPFDLRRSEPDVRRHSTQQTPADKDDENAACKRYSYAGPPKISLSTWNERPKRQVSIKTDRDYVIGIRQRLQQKIADVPPVAEVKPSSETDANKPVSRVPIVKSVELKKPYAEQLLQTTGSSPSVLALSEAIKAQAKLSNGYGGSGYRAGGCPAALSDDGDVVVKRSENKNDRVDRRQQQQQYTFGKLMTNRGACRKPREISANVDPRENLLESIRAFGGRDNLRKIRS